MEVGIVERWVDGVLVERWDPVSGLHTTFNADGSKAFEEPCTPAMAADAASALSATAVTENANQRTLTSALNQDLLDLQALIDTTNATINASPASYMKTIARVQRRIIRVALKRFEATT